jgi:hypothetical protein
MADPLFKGTDIPFTEEEESEMTDVYETYGTVVGMLGHLCNATRPDLSYSVNQCRSYTSNPRRHHWEALKRIVRYLKGTLNFGLVYSMVHGKDQLHAYCDADWATNEDDRKSVSGNVFMYMGAAIGWKSIKQTAVARSTAEAELAALDITARDALWYRKMIEALRISTSKTIPLFEDNAAASAIANGSQWSARQSMLLPVSLLSEMTSWRNVLKSCQLTLRTMSPTSSPNRWAARSSRSFVG